jgi:hypothetical protein
LGSAAALQHNKRAGGKTATFMAKEGNGGFGPSLGRGYIARVLEAGVVDDRRRAIGAARTAGRGAPRCHDDSMMGEALPSVLSLRIAAGDDTTVCTAAAIGLETPNLGKWRPTRSCEPMPSGNVITATPRHHTCRRGGDRQVDSAATAWFKKGGACVHGRRRRR